MYKAEGGVIIIGSLLWDESKDRQIWRKLYLNEKNEFLEWPIRYGRISKGRNCTFTMVIDKDCDVENMRGVGVLKKLKKGNINENVSRLISSEINKEWKSKNYFWSWGCVGYLVNPNSKIKEDLYKYFAESYVKFDSDPYNCLSKNDIISYNGNINIDWPETVNLDYIICTLTMPNVIQWPSSKLIALKMVVNDYSEYFIKNIQNGLATFQDNEVKKNLESINLDEI